MNKTKEILTDRSQILQDSDETTEEVLCRLISTVRYYGYIYLTNSQLLFDKEGYVPYSFMNQMSALYEFEKRLRMFNANKIIEVPLPRSIEECQEIVLATNVKQATTVFEESVKKELFIEPPRETMNKWVLRKMNSVFSGINLLEDELLIAEVQEAVPFPYIWIENQRQLFNYIKLYSDSLKLYFKQKIIPYHIYDWASRSLRDIKDVREISTKISNIQKIRETVSNSLRSWVRSRLEPILLNMNVIILSHSYTLLYHQFCDVIPWVSNFKDRRDNYTSFFSSITHEPPLPVQQLYLGQSCATNYYLYTALLGCKSKNLQSRVAPEFYSLFDEHFVELFASPLNHIRNMWCSMLPMDIRFGSMGSCWKVAPTGGCFLANPPFLSDFVILIIDKFKYASCFFLILSAIDKLVFPYEQLLPKGGAPGQVERYTHIEDTMIAYWGSDKNRIKDCLNVINMQYPCCCFVEVH